MAIVTFNSTPTKGTAGEMQLNKVDLAALASVSGDAYFSSNSNWNKVILYYKSSVGNQKPSVLFDATQATPLADFLVSAQARDVFEIQHIIIQDFDGGYFRVERSELVTAEFDVDLTPVSGGTGDYIYAGMSGGALVSQDAGATVSIKSTGQGLFSGAVKGVFTDIAGAAYAFNTSNNALYKSTDNGSSWSAVTVPSSPGFLRGGASHPNGSIFMACGNGVFESTDNGSTWGAPKTTANGLHQNSQESIAISPNGTILVSIGSLAGKISVSTDNGASYTERNSSHGLSASGSYSSYAFDSSNNIYVNDNASGNIYKSTDNGTSWSAISFPPGANLHIAVDTSDNIYVAGDNAGFVYKSTNGGSTWNSTTGNFGGSQLKKLSASPNGDIVALTSTSLCVSTDGAASFSVVGHGDTVTTNKGQRVEIF